MISDYVGKHFFNNNRQQEFINKSLKSAETHIMSVKTVLCNAT